MYNGSRDIVILIVHGIVIRILTKIITVLWLDAAWVYRVQTMSLHFADIVEELTIHKMIARHCCHYFDTDDGT